MLGLRVRRSRSPVTSAAVDLVAPRTVREERPVPISERTIRSACATLVSSKVVDRVSLWLPGLCPEEVRQVAVSYKVEATIEQTRAGCSVWLERKQEEES
jgi:hypothetical protein